ncbi:MAG: ACP S-malonyltransferase [Gammaproteobacteria bacterium]|nr:ACP S-malonyltransferase [Gammaproteobacteria bacterium]MCP5198364.1 ACP S-malonyltransferase [Gammaproteobacteria bacterium]
MAHLAFVFPGQGSQAVGMMNAMADGFALVRQRFASASEVLGFDLWDLVSNGPEDALNSTRNTQPALLAASVATWDAWLDCGGPRPAWMAGHSFGEYTALVCAGALDYAAAVALVADRGRYMQEAVPQGEGAMAAILGLDADAVAAACVAAAADGGTCSAANLNAPGQIVIAGSRDAVARACELAAARGAKRAMTLPVSVPAHCALMQPAATRLAERLAGIEFGAPDTSIVHNVDLGTHDEADAIRAALVSQLHSPVRWIETIERFAAAGVTQVCECGPGKVLAALIKRIDRGIACTSLGDPDSLRATARELAGEG